MAVNKVVYGGNVIIDISDSTVTPEKMLAGTVGYGADGVRMVGTATAQNFYPKAKRVEVTLPASGWVLSDGVYTQQINVDVAASDNPFVQCVLSEDYDTAVAEMYAMQFVERVQTFDGYIIASCVSDTGMDEPPEIDLTISLVTVEGLTQTTMAALACVSAKQIAVPVLASGWTWDGLTYRQTVVADIQATDVLFGDVLLSMDPTAAMDELAQMPRITDILPGNGSLEFVCYDTDGNGPPTVDITLLFKVCEGEQPPVAVEDIVQGDVSFVSGSGLRIAAANKARATVYPVGQYLKNGATYNFSLGAAASGYRYRVIVMTANAPGLSFDYVANTDTYYSSVTSQNLDSGWINADYTYVAQEENLILAVALRRSDWQVLTDDDYAALDNFTITETV